MRHTLPTANASRRVARALGACGLCVLDASSARATSHSRAGLSSTAAASRRTTRATRLSSTPVANRVRSRWAPRDSPFVSHRHEGLRDSIHDKFQGGYRAKIKFFDRALLRRRVQHQSRDRITAHDGLAHDDRRYQGHWAVWKSTSAPGAPKQFFTNSFLGDDAEDNAMIQHERAVQF